MARADEIPKLSRTIDVRSAERFVEVNGRRIALLGNELGVFECWIWPLKILHDLEPHFRLGAGKSIPGRDVARLVEVSSTHVEIAYEHPDFRVKLEAIAAFDQRAVVLLFDVESVRGVTLELRFTPDFRPMWPAGLGGQIAYRDDESGAFVMTEELGRFAALIGAPEADPIQADSDHGLPRDPTRIEIPISNSRARRGRIPVVIVGATHEPDPLTAAAKLGEEGAARGHARSRTVVAKARELYRRALLEWPDWRDELERHWRGFNHRNLSFLSGNRAHSEAFQWAQIALERAWVEVDGLGRGLVAGLGVSGSSERPGFGWFFDGDALVAARAMSRSGNFEGAKRVLEFAASHQRADGKMMHELVLSAPLCNWIDDYPYAYYKGVNTPDFLGALRVYLDCSGDRELLEKLWPHVERAFAHCLACLDERGLYSVRKAGIAAVEAGPLVGRMESEVFAHGLWLEALDALARFASVRDDRELATKVETERVRAIAAAQLFWNEAQHTFAFAKLVDGALWPDLTAYHGQFLLAHGDAEFEARLDRTAARLNEPALAADWGLRMFPTDSRIYDASSYNHGSVFPYLNDFAIRALFARNQASAAQQLLDSQIALDGFSGLGFVPEHLVGDRARAPRRGVPHQIFSSACILQSTLAGVFGLEVDALRPSLTLRPTFPIDGELFELWGIAVGASRIDVHLHRERKANATALSAVFWLRAGPKVEIEFAPRLAPLSKIESKTVDGFPGSKTELAGTRAFEWLVREGPTLGVESAPLELDAESESPRMVLAASDERSATWNIFGLAGRRERLYVRSDRELTWRGASFIGGPLADRPGVRALDVEFGAGTGFVRRGLSAETAD